MLEEKPFGYGLHLLDDAFGRADPPVQWEAPERLFRGSKYLGGLGALPSRPRGRPNP